MAYLGDLRLGDTLDFKFCTVQSTGAPTTLAGSPVISAYPANSTTQLTAGITLSVDFDSVTGLNNVRVVASSGNGYATATNYEMVITTGTVNSVSAVGYVVGTFSIENRSAVMPTTAGRTLDVSSGGEAGLDWANVGSPTTSNALTGTTIATTQKVDVDTIKTNPVVNAGTITFPTTATLASTTNITAGTITTATNLTNAPTAGDLTATMKTSVTTAATASTPTATISVGTGAGQLNIVSGAVPVKGNFKKNTAVAGFSVLMTDSTTHLPATGLTVSVQRNIDNGGWGAGTNSVTEQTSGGSNGTYAYSFSAADLNGDNIQFLFTATGADSLYFVITTFVA